MRNVLADLLTESAGLEPEFIVLSGDHGYALFDPLLNRYPDQFLNVGISEQSMIGYAVGLTRLGFRPVVYGLASFVPMRVLEQIKLDACFSKAPVLFIGDGAGLVYSTLGASHHCAEDVAALRALPNLRIYSPCDGSELKDCYKEARAYAGPSYLRVGKSDRATVHRDPLGTTEPRWVYGSRRGDACLVATGSMVSVAASVAAKHGASAICVPRLKPFASEIAQMVSGFKLVITLEEHSRFGGLFSALAETLCGLSGARPRVEALALKDKFADRCGSYQYALSEHGMADPQVEASVAELIAKAAPGSRRRAA